MWGFLLVWSIYYLEENVLCLQNAILYTKRHTLLLHGNNKSWKTRLMEVFFIGCVAPTVDVLHWLCLNSLSKEIAWLFELLLMKKKPLCFDAYWEKQNSHSYVLLNRSIGCKTTICLHRKQKILQLEFILQINIFQNANFKKLYPNNKWHVMAQNLILS